MDSGRSNHLFDPGPYEIPIEEQMAYMGEHPPETLAQALSECDKMHDAGDFEAASAHFERWLNSQTLF